MTQTINSVTGEFKWIQTDSQIGEYTFNGMTTDVEYYFTPFDLITVNIGADNLWLNSRYVTTTGLRTSSTLSLSMGWTRVSTCLKVWQE